MYVFIPACRGGKIWERIPNTFVYLPAALCPIGYRGSGNDTFKCYIRTSMTKNLHILLILPMLLIASAAFPQQRTADGEVNIVQDPRVDMLLEKHINANAAFDGLTGYRIQIFFDSGSNARNRANNERRRFMTLFPQTKAYVSFDAPNFKVRVGNFRTRLEAERWLREIQRHFEMAYVVPSRIELPQL